MKKIGVLFGMENTFPGALVERINGMAMPEVTAEFVQLGAVRMAEPSGYAVIVDRISHDVPFYRAWLKNAALDGAYIINNPFWWSADDKFFNYALATRLGVAIPPTVVLPHKEHPAGNDRAVDAQPAVSARLDRHLRVRRLPGVPQAVRRRRLARRPQGVNTRRSSSRPTTRRATLCMTLQRGVNFKEYFRCYVVGQEDVRIMPYDPRAPFHERYVRHPPAYDPGLLARVERDARTLCRALGYDFNTVEFAVEDGMPYAIDFMNPAPDADVHSVGREQLRLGRPRVAELAVQKRHRTAAVRRPALGSVPQGIDEALLHARHRGGVPDDRSRDLRPALAHQDRAHRARASCSSRSRSRPRCTSR